MMMMMRVMMMTRRRKKESGRRKGNPQRRSPRSLAGTNHLAGRRTRRPLDRAQRRRRETRSVLVEADQRV